MRIGSMLGLVLAMLLACPAPAAENADARLRDRERIAAERREADRRFDAARRQCEQRFAVTACLEDARSERRRVLDRLADEQAALDEAQRRTRAAERLRSIQAKTAAAPAAHGPAASAPAARVLAASAPVATTALPMSAAPSSSGASAPIARARASGTAPQAAARHRQAQQAREHDAQVHREAVIRRNAERDARKPPAAPLPVPSAPSGGGR